MSSMDIEASYERGRIATIGVIMLASLPIAWNASSGPHLFDAGELVAASVELGASHPPGQPLHALLGNLMALLPIGPLPYRVALASVVFGAFAAYSASSIVLDALVRSRKEALTFSWILPSAVALAVLFAPAVAPQLGRPEVYTLALALMLVGARALISWASQDKNASSSLRVAALMAGLALAVHPPHALALVVIGLVLLLLWRRDVLMRPRALALAAIACSVGAATLVYLPTRAMAGAPMWGDPTTARGFFAYVSGAAYTRNLGTRGGSFFAQVLESASYILVPAGIGIAYALYVAFTQRRETNARKRIGITAAAASAAMIAAWLQPLERANPDNIAYAAPAMTLFFVLGGVALTHVAKAKPLLIGALGLLMAPLPFTDFDSAFRAHLPQLEPLAFATIDIPPPRSLVVARNDFTAATWMEAQTVEGARPDVALFIEGLSTSSWHWRTLAQHPLFDGTPIRSGPGSGHAPWVRGAIERAFGRVAVCVENDASVLGRGTVAGPYLLLAPGLHDARDMRSFGERTFAGSGHMLAWAPTSFGGLGHGVVRDAEITRARRLFVRRETALAIAALRRAASPLPSDATREADGLNGDVQRAVPTIVRDPTAIFPTAEDAIRELAMMLFAMGEPMRAARLLEEQQGRGDDRALLQLARMQTEDGLLEPARAAEERYRALHPSWGQDPRF
jgi:hypothetical protein